MEEYIFISTDGYTEGPDGETVQNSQVIGYGHGLDAEDAFDNMIKLNEWIMRTSFDEVISMPINRHEKEYHFIKS